MTQSGSGTCLLSTWSDKSTDPCRSSSFRSVKWKPQHCGQGCTAVKKLFQVFTSPQDITAPLFLYKEHEAKCCWWHVLVPMHMLNINTLNSAYTNFTFITCRSEETHASLRKGPLKTRSRAKGEAEGRWHVFHEPRGDPGWKFNLG